MAGVESGEFEAPLCPEHGLPMELRMARRGARAGHHFFGCPRYPDCRETAPADDGVAVESEQPDLSQFQADAPDCPNGHGAMVLKMARRGRNRGRPFWSCGQYPECQETVDFEDEDALPRADEAGTRGHREPISTRRRSVLWMDATLDREGWTCRYTQAGASLRAHPVISEAASSVSVCWFARTDGFSSGDADVQRVVGLLRKIVQRGAAPPIPPEAERLLLEKLGFSERMESSLLPGDLSVRLKADIDVETLRSAAGLGGDGFELDRGLHFDSDLERRFLTEWIPKNLGEAAARWILPQASLEALAGTGAVADLGRRVDFLVVSPWLTAPFVIEVDGAQHDRAQAVDDERDGLLAASGLEVVRIPAAELRAGRGLGLDDLRQRWQMLPTDPGETYRDLLYGPAQLNRLALALLDALAAGFLPHDVWSVEVEDPLDVAVGLLAPYLDLFGAVDRLWGGHVMPAEIRVGGNGKWRRFSRLGAGYQEPEVTEPPERVDVLVRLQVDRGPTESLPPHSETPQVVVRSAFLPVTAADPVFEGAGRIEVRTEGEEIEEALRIILQSVFAKSDFREGQLDALLEVIEGRDCAVLLPTGAGKSLIYQLAGLCLPGRTLIIDPLVALMEDQAEGLHTHGVDRIALLSSYQTQRGERDDVLGEIASGEAMFIFVAPERLQQRSFRNALRELSQVSPINLAVVDEAHCVSEWGHDFRPSYLNLGKVLREVCRDPNGEPPPLLALTGTASRAVLRDVLIELGIERDSERSVVRPRTFDREELRFNVVRTIPNEALPALTGFLRSLPSKFGVSATDFFRPRGDNTFSGVVFCPHTNGSFGVIEVAAELAPVVGRAPVTYSGGAPKGIAKEDWEPAKRRNAEAFKRNHAPLLVSTKAFGMGIDKANIRYVVHFGIPGSIESYYQEVGRAGRDRRRAECGLVLVEYDERRSRQLLDDESDLEEARLAADAIRLNDSDDVSRQLWFHLNSFRGVDEELLSLRQVLEDMAGIGARRSVEIPFGNGDDAKKNRERALHRLTVLSIVRDYEVGSSFAVELNETGAALVVEALLDYVGRNQPGRVDAVREQASPSAGKSLAQATEECAQILIEFVYDTVERSRRRSLREMWLAARESGADANRLFRGRILDYLAQGDITPTLERLVDLTSFSYGDWALELGQVTTAADARELRGNTARLLASYPDHPGMLFARGLSEVIDNRGDLAEFGTNLEASLRSASDRYGVSDDEFAEFVEWLFAFCEGQFPRASTAALGIVDRLGLAPAVVRKRLDDALANDESDPGLRVLALAASLERTASELDQLTTHYEGSD